jgi:hypothetical protein
MRFPRCALVLFLVLAAFTAVARASEPVVKDLACAFKGKDLVVSLTVEGALDAPEIKEAVNSTRPFSLTFTVDIVRHLAAWPDRPAYRSVVIHTVLFDNLTHQYILETTLNGEKTDKRKVATWEEMATYMANVSGLVFKGVSDLDLKSGKYALRARVLVQTQFLLVIIPYDVLTPWATRPLAPP